MEPTMQSGDWLLVDPDAYRPHPPVVGDLVVVPDPRLHERLLVKRVVEIDGVGDLVIAGDLPGASTDSRSFGAVDAAAVRGRPWFRYWPLSRPGRVR
jgi:hypothetical protein